MEYITRAITPAIERGSQYFPVTIITGPRQSGKSTLCNHIFKDYAKYNLEDAGLRDAVEADPKGFIDACGNKVVIDEIQHLPQLFSYIQLTVDAQPQRRFALTVSNNFTLMEKITQSLPGRAVLFTLLPLSLEETGNYAQSPTNDLLLNGLYPSVVTGARPADMFYSSYYATYAERDVRQIKNITDLHAFRKFIRLIAGRTGCEMNASQLANETGVSAPTINSWLSVLEASYICFTLSPYYANISKRLTKTPKIYFYDTGLLCYLLGIETASQLATHPLRGSIFENLAVTELVKQRLNQGKHPNLCFYRENSGKEVDIVRLSGDRLDLFEVKSSMTFNKVFTTNIDYLKQLLGDKVNSAHVIYDGDNVPPIVYNVRKLSAL